MAKKNENLPVEIDQNLIDESVEFINRTGTEFLYKGSVEIGNYVLEKFFNNDLDEVTSKNPYKAINFKTLCESNKLSIQPSHLLQMVRVADQENKLAKQIPKIVELSYSHRVELIKITDLKVKIALANDCIKNKYSVRDFRDKVNNERIKLIPKKKSAKELTPVKRINKTILRMNSLFKSQDEADSDIDDNILYKIKSDKRELLKEKTDNTIEKLNEELEYYKKLKDHIKKVEEHIEQEKAYKENKTK